MDIIIAGTPTTLEDIKQASSLHNHDIILALVDKIEEQQRVIDGLEIKNNNLYRELNRRITGNEIIQEDGSVEESEEIDFYEGNEAGAFDYLDDPEGDDIGKAMEENRLARLGKHMNKNYDF